MDAIYHCKANILQAALTHHRKDISASRLVIPLHGKLPPSTWVMPSRARLRLCPLSGKNCLPVPPSECFVCNTAYFLHGLHSSPELAIHRQRCVAFFPQTSPKAISSDSAHHNNVAITTSTLFELRGLRVTQWRQRVACVCVFFFLVSDNLYSLVYGLRIRGRLLDTLFSRLRCWQR